MGRGYSIGTPGLLVLIYCVFSGQAVIIETNPDEINIGNSLKSDFTVSCTSNDLTTSSTPLEVGRTSFNGSYTQTAYIFLGNIAVVTDPTLRNRVNATGYINGTFGVLHTIFTNLVCIDGNYTYSCRASEAGGPAQNSTTVEVKSYPENLTMTVSPIELQYEPSTEIEITCTGLVGNQFNTAGEVDWLFEWRTGPRGQWTKYETLINLRTDPSSVGDCQYKALTSFPHTVTTLDNVRQFRCYVLGVEYGYGAATIYADSDFFKPKDFFCANPSSTSIELKWFFNNTRYSYITFDLKYRYFEDKNWIPVNIWGMTGQSFDKSVTVTSLLSDSLYYFRLIVDGGVGGQSEAVTVTCYTAANLSPSIGAGIGIGIVIMLFLGGGAFLLFFFRQKLTTFYSDCKSRTTSSTPRSEPMPSSHTPTGATTSNASEAYEVPGNFYDGLQGKDPEKPSTYEDLGTTYMNM